MLSTNNNDILFDDLKALRDQLITFSATKGDCGNLFETETAEKQIQYGDCGN